MKINPYWKMSACLAAAGLTWLGSMTAGQAAAPALNGQLELRPLTQTEIQKYGLTGAQFSGGLTTVGLGEPVYLEALVNAAIAPSNIVGVTWSLTTPSGSTASFLPVILGTNVPLFNAGDIQAGESGNPVYQLADRHFFRPDVVGQYTVNATITTVGSGSTNLVVNITGATYLGLQTCAACHSGQFSGAPSVYNSYTNTLHASMFTRGIDGVLTPYYSKSCIECHTVGYDTNSFAVNGGFDDVANEYGWTFPATLSPTNWACTPSAVQNLANIQCENCHGPGSQHLFSQGVTGNTNAISVTYNAGDCSQCHDELSHHYYSAEWNNSLHAQMTHTPSGSPNRIACVRCHTAAGFEQYVENQASPGTYVTNYNYGALSCQGCHNPHDATNPHQLRTSLVVSLSDGTAVTNAGFGGFCMNCHTSRNGSVTNSIVNYPQLLPTWNGGSGFGPHDGPQGDMLEGVNGYTYGQVLPNSPHANVVSNTCVGCHMQPIASSDPAFTLAGGHSTKMSYTNNLGAKVAVTYVCAQCHGNINTFDFPVADYDGDGVVEGVQTEVQNLLNKLSTLLPPSGYQVNPANYMADGKVKASVSTYTNMPAKFLQAAYNWQFVNNDGSKGVHNAAYAVALLKASIANLTGVSSTGGLPDSWVLEYFGSLTNAAAAPNAINNAAGVPNWMMYALGLAPNAGFSVGNDGVVYFNGNNIVDGATNTIAIYKAAEIAFDTQVGTTYTIQGINSLTGSWQNISTNIPGTGGTISYLTPTRQNLQMFYRVVHTP